MATLATNVHTLVDIASRMDPNGKTAKIAELLTATNDVLPDVHWAEGNLPTGERTTVRTSLPSVQYRAINEGVPRSKSTVAQVDEGAAELVGEAQVDRSLAILSGDPAQYRLNEASPFFEAMNQQMVQTLFYGNAKVSPRQFTGLAPRYNSLSGFTAKQIIDAGGTGSTNRSVWLIAWGENTIKGIYPKGTKAGLLHFDSTSNLRPGDDDYPIGDYITDAAGNQYLGYKDHYQWNCGFAVKDYRYAIRICNIDRTTLTFDGSSGAILQRLMVIAQERIQSMSGPGTTVGFYAPRIITTYLRTQLLEKKNAFLSWDEMAGKRVMTFGETVVRRVDGLDVDEARVV